MNKEKFKEMWIWLENHTQNFQPKFNSYDEILKCVERQENNYDNILKIAIKSLLNINQNHYLINGNKRVAIGVFNLIKDDNWVKCKEIFKLLENE